MTPASIRVELAGGSAVIVYLDRPVAPETMALLQQVQMQVRLWLGDALLQAIPSYASVLFELSADVDPLWVIEQLPQNLNLDDAQPLPGKLVELPVWYLPHWDLQRVAEHCGLTTEQVIQRHSEQNYLVYSIGFAPGFAYLGQLTEELSTPRLATPRSKVPKGAVAIADRQTAVYPAASPGGWNILGLCPLPLFNPDALSRDEPESEDPVLPFAVGDRVRFNPITRAEFIALGGVMPEELKL